MNSDPEISLIAAMAAIPHPQIDREEGGFCSCEFIFYFWFTFNVPKLDYALTY